MTNKPDTNSISQTNTPTHGTDELIHDMVKRAYKEGWMDGNSGGDNIHDEPWANAAWMESKAKASLAAWNARPESVPPEVDEQILTDLLDQFVLGTGWIFGEQSKAYAIKALLSLTTPSQEVLEDLEEYLHWRKVNPQIKGGENYLKRLRQSLAALQKHEHPSPSQELREGAAIVRKLVDALVQELRFRETCRNADPGIEDFRDWQKTEDTSIDAIREAKRWLNKQALSTNKQEGE